MDDSDSEFEIERVNSVEEALFDEVPRDLKFMLKFKTKENKTYKVLEYDLTKGKALPYTLNLKGKTVNFNRAIKPSIDGMVELPCEKENWFIFQDRETSSSNDSSHKTQDRAEPRVLNKLELALMSSKGYDKDRLAPVACLFCANRYPLLETAIDHINLVHPDWENMIEDRQERLQKDMGVDKDTSLTVEAEGSLQVDQNSSLDLDTSLNTSQHPVLDDTIPLEASKDLNRDQGSKSYLNNPHWFPDMREAFKESVVGGLSRRAIQAIENNEDIQDVGIRRKIQLEILGGTVSYLQLVFGEDTPKQKHTKQVAELLASEYPAMFQLTGGKGPVPTFSGYGLGGLKGLKSLPERICNLYRDRKPGRLVKRKRADNEEGGAADEPAQKKGRTKHVYGVNNTKFYAADSSQNSLQALKQAAKHDHPEDREKIFREQRPALMKLIRDSGKHISKVCEGFFKHPSHLQEHFHHLTEVNISEKIERGLLGHLGNLEAYLVSVNDNLEFTERLKTIKDDCALLFRGSNVHLFLNLLREAGDHFDGDGSALMRIENDGNPKTSSPHLFARKLDESYVFELWVEKECIMGNMGLATSISSFLHLVFCFNLKYPKTAETVCDFLQRVVADFGNDEGTRTNKSKATAENKLTKYHIQLGKVLGARNAI